MWRGQLIVFSSNQNFSLSPVEKKIEYYLEEARRTGDPKWFIKAYSAETGFYRAINEALAQGASNIHYEDIGYLHSFVGCLYVDESLKKYCYSGQCYGGLHLSKEDFDKNYKVRHSFLIKPFTSTSKRREIAEFFAFAHSANLSQQLSALCIYTIPKETERYYTSIAVDISSLSEYPEEEEVLILPHVPFTIQSISHSPTRFITIELVYFY
jgi:hypothetical protein